MDKKALLMSRGATFMVNTIVRNLKEGGYKTTQIDPNVEDLDAHLGDADIIIFYLGDYVGEITDTLVYLKDVCTERDKLLLLIGNPVELATVEETIPSAVLAGRFERPLNVKDFISELDRLAEVNDDMSRKKSLLLVDDDSTFLKMMKGWLSPYYRVTIVTSGAQALMYVADNTPDLILLDYEMPVTSGPQVLGMLRAEPRVAGIPVIFLTGKGDRESVMQVLALKPDGYLLKSIERQALLENLAEFFAKQKYKEMHLDA